MKNRIQMVRDRIEGVLKKAGRDSGSVRIVLASKYADGEMLKEALEGGITIVGDNTVRAAEANQSTMNNEQFIMNNQKIEHHLIGHLQTNKAKKAVKIFSCIHSLDSARLADALQKELSKISGEMDVLLQVNIAGEDQKSGIPEEELDSLVEHVMKMPELHLRGLMTMPPYIEMAEDNRAYFAKLRGIRDGLEKRFGIALPHLSMGTSQDFLVAIEEGATYVRLGKVLFSPYFFDQVMGGVL
jgi:PLP dependent protein